MSFDYARSKATADRLIERFGEAITLRTTSRLGDVSSRAGRMVVVETVRRELDGSSVRLGDLKILLDAASAPRAGDLFERDGEDFVIRQELNPINPAGTVLAYEAFAGPA